MTKQKTGQKIVRYLGIDMPKLPDKGVKRLCIYWIEGKVIPVVRGKRCGISRF